MSDNLISRQTVIDMLDAGAELLRRVLDNTDVVGIARLEYEYELKVLESYIADIKELPSVEPYWIPCSERLPEKEGRYLVTDDAGGMKTVQDDEFLHCEDGTSSWMYSQNVTAWMPFPAPYTKKQDLSSVRRFYI